MNIINQCVIPESVQKTWIGLGMAKKLREYLAEGIRRQLRLCNMEQRDLAKKLLVSEATISRWLSGEQMPRDEKVDEICEIFGTDPIELISSGKALSPSGKVIVDIQKLATEHGYIIKKKDT